MNMNRAALAASVAAALVIAGCSKEPESAPVATPKPTALVDAARIDRAGRRRMAVATAAPTTSSASARWPGSTSGNVAQLGLAWSYRPRHRASRAGIDAAGHRRRHVRDQRLEQVVCARCAHRQGDLALRSEGAGRSGRQGLLRRRESRRRGLERQDLSRHARWPADRPRRRHRQTALGSDDGAAGSELHHHRRAARVRRQGAHRQRRRRARRARLTSPPTTPRPASRSGASTPCRAIPRNPSRARRWRRRRKTWKGEWWKLRRRRHGVGFHRLRPEARSHLYRRRQRQPVEPGSCAARVAATICSCRRSSRSRPRPANTSGTSRPRRAKPGTTPPRSP